MAQGKHHIQLRMPNGNWRTDLQMCMMGEAFAKGAFFAIKAFSGGGFQYRLIKGAYITGSNKDDEVEVLDTHSTGNIKIK